MRKILITTVMVVVTSFATAQIKVACVGNSITFGAGVQNREKNSYPKQLQYRLGDNYVVENFGISARTLIKKGDLPYTNEKIYQKSLEFKPDIVVIKLGTNDLKPQNSKYIESDFYNDYKELINSYKNVNPNVRVIICKPVRCFLPDEEFSSKVMNNQVIPILEKLAYDLDCEIVNLNSVFDDQWVERFMPDKLHPSSIGAGMLADRIAPAIVNDEKCDLKIDGKESSFYGFKMIDFVVGDAQCKIVFPKNIHPDRPWIWRARFFGHEPQLDIDLLEKGFCVAYCDVADLFGAPVAVKRWDKFYNFATKNLKLNKKVALEGMSRGGLIVYNWAAKNPTKVAAIYADAPVMDFMSWPVAVNWKQDINNMIKAYGFKDIEEAKKWKNQPIDHAKKLINIPIIHVVGDVDDIVTVKDNTAVFEERFKKAGGSITVIDKPNVGHHPHSLKVPDQLTNFILKAYKIDQNRCIKPLPGNEFRAAAGWTKGADWHAVADEINQLLTKQTDILFIGNSITQGIGGERTKVSWKPGKQAADSLFEGKTYVAAGISGDKTQHIIWRLSNGNYEKAYPKVVFIMIGINNITAGDDPQNIAQGVVKCAQIAKNKFPNAEIFILGALPAGENNSAQVRQNGDKVHKYLQNVKWDGVRYVNPTKWFVKENGEIIKEYYADDLLHLEPLGYENWMKNLKNLINEKL